MSKQAQTMHTLPARATLPATAPPPGGHPMEIWISHVLRAGVLIAAAVISLGLALFLVKGPGPGDPTSLQELRARGSQAIAVGLGSILNGIQHGQAGSVIQLGLLLLILTPVARVAMTFVLFLAQRDRIFTAVTLAVLAILVLGLIGVGA
jgi:uncharacterized membrane protein